MRVKYRKHNWSLNAMESSAVPVVAAGDGGRKKTRSEIAAADDIGPHAEWDKLLQWCVNKQLVAALMSFDVLDGFGFGCGY